MIDSTVDAPPAVLVAILARNKAYCLSLYLRCIEEQDYPKDRIGLWICSNHNTDSTARMLQEWEPRARALRYREVRADYEDVEPSMARLAEHEWPFDRLDMLRTIRQASLRYARDHGYDFYFVVDCDNFIRPSTLRELVSRRRPVIGPLLHDVRAGSRYANYHHCVDASGYFVDCSHYDAILERRSPGEVPVDVVHCTYLVDLLHADRLTYQDGTDRHEYVVFSASCRAAGVQQYLDTSRPWGFLILQEGCTDASLAEERMRWLE